MHCLKDPALPLLHFNEVFAVVQASCWGCLSPDDRPVHTLAADCCHMRGLRSSLIVTWRG